VLKAYILLCAFGHFSDKWSPRSQKIGETKR